ncbi:MAG: hypothetical protein FJ296_11265 [Planctomycetes bacterium]|nr:hypothetical protein [Planctomycetota bacterium]
MKTTAILGLCGLLLLAAPAAAQDTRGTPADTGRAVTDLTDVPPEDLPRVERLVADEATHRDRTARIRRLRELAVERGDTERLRQLDELERRELQLHEDRLAQHRRTLSARSWQGTQDFLRRGGRMRATLGGGDPQRERIHNQKVQREREANQGQPQQRRASGSQPSRPPARAPARAPRAGSPR